MSKDEWNENELFNSIIKDIKQFWIGERQASINFEFDLEFIEEIERRIADNDFIERMSLMEESYNDEIETEDDFDIIY